MELLEAIKLRRSIRKFKTTELPEDFIMELIEAGRLAPSGSNLQPTRYVIIKSESAKSKLKECTPLPFVSEAPAVIACLVDMQSILSTEERYKELVQANAFAEINTVNTTMPKGKNLDTNAMKSYLNFNAAIAIDHITLRAVDLGIGSCIVMMFDKDKVKDLLGLSDRYEVVALLPIGYTDNWPTERPRLATKELLLNEI